MRFKSVIAAIILAIIMSFFNAQTNADVNGDPKVALTIIERELLNKCFVCRKRELELESKDQAIDNLNRYIEETNKKTKEIAKLNPLEVDEETLSNLPSFPKDFAITNDLGLIAEGKKAENNAKALKKKIQAEQERERKLKEEIRLEEERKREERKRKDETKQYNRKSSDGKNEELSESAGEEQTSSSPPQSTPTPQKSYSSSREQWMWQLINSYPEPARRGLNGAQVVSALDNNYAGVTYPDTMTIKIANWIKDNTFRGAVAHEIGHIYHLRTGLDQTQEWIDIYNAEWAGSGYYGSVNPMEAFADSFKAIYEPGSYGSRPTSQIPRSVEYIKRNLNSGI